MTTKTVTMFLRFDEVVEDDYTHHDLKSVQMVHSQLTNEELDVVVERLAQSDFGTIGFPNGIMKALDNGGDRVMFDYRS